jgi:hypothetical protein
MGWLYIYIKLNHELYVLVDYYFILFLKKRNFLWQIMAYLMINIYYPPKKKKKKKKRDRDSLPT